MSNQQTQKNAPKPSLQCLYEAPDQKHRKQAELARKDDIAFDKPIQPKQVEQREGRPSQIFGSPDVPKAVQYGGLVAPYDKGEAAKTSKPHEPGRFAANNFPSQETQGDDKVRRPSKNIPQNQFSAAWDPQQPEQTQRQPKGMVSDKQAFMPFDKQFGMQDHPKYSHAMQDSQKPQATFKQVK